MHHEIRQGLEEYLSGDSTDPEIPARFKAHLGECAECTQELEALRAQAGWLRTLRASEDVEPRPGFYARVMERIEAQPASIWSVFLEPRFGFRLAVASAALAALLGTYLVVSEPSGPELASSPPSVSKSAGISRPAGMSQNVSTSVAGTQAASDEDGAWQEQQRDAVLVNLASYRQ